MIPARCAWDAWPGLRERLGLRVREVIMGENAETTIVVDVPEEVKTATPEVQQPVPEIQPKDSKLSHRLAELFAWCQQHPGKPKRIELPGGMRVDAILGLDAVMRMQISREGMWPSDTEWETTIRHLPFEVETGEPERFEYKGAFYLRTEWGWM